MSELKNNKKGLIALGLIVIAIVVLVIIAFLSGKKPGNQIYESNSAISDDSLSGSDFVPDYDSKDQINTMGNTNGNYLLGAVAAGQGHYQYYIKDEYYICKEEIILSPPEYYTSVWCPADTGVSGQVERLSVCGDWLYFLLSNNLCRVRTDGSQFSYLIMSDDDYETRKYVVYKGKVYLKKQTPISVTSTNDYIYEFDPDTLGEKQICDANDRAFLGMDEDYIVLYDSQKEEYLGGQVIEIYGYVEENIYIYKITGELISTIKLGDNDDHLLRINLSDGKMFCFSYNNWSNSLSLNNIKVISLKDGKTQRILNPNPQEGSYWYHGHILVSGDYFVLYYLGSDSGAIGYLRWEDWEDFNRWIPINDDYPDKQFSVVGDQIYYTIYEKNTTSGATDLYRISMSPFASETHDFESLSDKGEYYDDFGVDY